VRCPNCGAPISKRERYCSFCGRGNDRYEPAGAHVLALLARGKEADSQGRWADAVEALAQVVEQDPEVFDAYFYLADAWAHLGMLDRAEEAMKGAAKIRPGSAVVWFNRATIAASRGRTGRARKLFQKASELAESDPSLADRQEFLERIRTELRRLK
jgi:tetratricopeptide (TPR) repeat protein